MLNLLEDIFPVTLLLIIVASFIFIVLLPFIASWNLFKKAGIPGYKSLIPIYNQYLILKISGMSGLWLIIIYSNLFIDLLKETMDSKLPHYIDILFFTIYILSLVFAIIRSYKLAKAFNRGIIFMIGLFFFPTLFEIILGIDSSKYIGEYNKKEN